MRACGAPLALAVLYLIALVRILPGTSAAVVDAEYYLADVDASYLPNYPAVYNTGAVMTLTANEPIYYHAGNCRTNALCADPTVIKCCNASDCDPVLLSKKPGAPTNCVCPSAPGAICVDTTTPVCIPAYSPSRTDSSPPEGRAPANPHVS